MAPAVDIYDPHSRGHKVTITRQFRFTNWQKWKLPQIVNILPIAFFLIGLYLLVPQFHPSILIIVVVVTYAAIGFLVIMAVHLDCPYRLPIQYFTMSLAVYALEMLHFEIFDRLHLSSSGHPCFLRRPSSIPNIATTSPQSHSDSRAYRLHGCSSKTPNPYAQRNYPRKQKLLHTSEPTSGMFDPMMEGKKGYLTLPCKGRQNFL